jgi:putative toxin-antitoxin system antitoxin component (TIGR02293 family)
MPSDARSRSPVNKLGRHGRDRGPAAGQPEGKTRQVLRRGAVARGSVQAGVNTGKQLSERIAKVREGYPLTELDHVAQLLGVERSQLAKLLGVTVRTLQRKAGTAERLGPAASDRLARIQRIHELAIHVLGESAKASRWLTSTSRPLGGVAPLQLLDTDLGTQRVQQELREIEFGMPA